MRRDFQRGDEVLMRFQDGSLLPTVVEWRSPTRIQTATQTFIRVGEHWVVDTREIFFDATAQLLAPGATMGRHPETWRRETENDRLLKLLAAKRSLEPILGKKTRGFQQKVRLRIARKNQTHLCNS